MDTLTADEPPARRAPALLALAYASFGLAWIVLSDRLLQFVAPDVATLSAVGQGKGIAFVLATSGLLYAVAARRRRALPAEAKPRDEVSSSSAWVLALLAGVIVLASLVGYASAAHGTREQQIAQLGQEAELKAELVQRWMQRQHDKAAALVGDATLRDSLLHWQAHPDEAATTAIRRQLQLIAATGGYADALLLDGQARPLVAAGGTPVAVGAGPSSSARRAWDSGRIGHSDFQAHGSVLGFDLLLPLADRDGRSRALLLLRTLPERNLLPQLTARSAGGAAETLLLRAGATAVLASGAAGDAAVRSWAPAASAAASLAVLASQPTLAGALVDGLGTEPMAAVAAPIRNSDWFVAVQTPRHTLDAGSWAGAAALALVNILAVLAAGAALYAIQQRRELRAAMRIAADHEEKQRAWKIAEAIANCSTDAIFAKDLQGRYLFVNRALCRAFGRTPEELIGADAGHVFPPSSVRQFLENDAAALRADKPIYAETRVPTAEGEVMIASTKGKLVDDDGRTIGVYGVASDVTERRDLQQRMRQWATVFDDIRDGVVITDPQGRIRAVNRAFSTITGYAADEALGSGLKLLKSGRHGPEFYQQMWAALAERGHWQGEIWNRRKNGDIYPEWLTVSAVREDDGGIAHYVGVFTDISRLKHSEAQTDWLFNHDPLTRLPNRNQLQVRLEEVLSRSQRRECRAVLLVIGLDSFKTVNDSLGHPAGDELLVCIAQRLQARLRQEDLLGRLGGDEFLVLLEGNPDHDGVTALACDLIAAVAAPVALSCGPQAYVTASIGISLFPEQGSPTAVELLRDAEAAMHRAKELGRNRFCFYSEDMNARAMTKLELEAALSQAIERRELLLHYQPKVDGHSGRVVGAEALLRWQRQGVGLVPPGDFIPLAEHSSLILSIGAWVIDAACRQIRQWLDEGRPVVRIAVNVAARQFAAGDLDSVVARALEAHRVPPCHLELELTEGMLISNPQAGRQMLQRLRELGIKVSLDDFGTGYSSLAYLQQFPIDALKIDQSFVRRIGDPQDGEALVDAIIGLAHRLRLRVVAEGVETEAQRDYLRGRHCDEMQGYHFARPGPAAALEALLDAQRSESVAA